MYSFHFYCWNQLNSFRWPVQYVQKTSPNFLLRQTQVDNTVDKADITQSQAANLHRPLSHMTLGLIKCRK